MKPHRWQNRIEISVSGTVFLIPLTAIENSEKILYGNGGGVYVRELHEQSKRAEFALSTAK